MLNRISKFVAAVLTTALLAAPVSAAGLCLVQKLGSRGCNTGCPMMRTQGHQSGLQIMASPPVNRSCCQVSPASPTPKLSAFTDQNRRWGQVHQLEAAWTIDHSPEVDESALPEPAPPRSTSAHQALLCVFLVSSRSISNNLRSVGFGNPNIGDALRSFTATFLKHNSQELRSSGGKRMSDSPESSMKESAT